MNQFIALKCYTRNFVYFIKSTAIAHSIIIDV